MFFNKKKKRLNSLIEEITKRKNLPEYRLEEIKEFAENNEGVIAIEVLAESLFEFTSELDKQFYDEIVYLADKDNFNIHESRYIFLQKLVKE